ncbi:unnamed protein product, partial [Linum tenue]
SRGACRGRGRANITRSINRLNDAAADDSRPSPSIGSFCCWKAHIQCGVVCRAIPSIFMELNFFDKGKDPISFNLVDPVQRNTMSVTTGGWTHDPVRSR